jgi:hypothetical protein
MYGEASLSLPFSQFNRGWCVVCFGTASVTETRGGNATMKSFRTATICILVCLALPAAAADRVRAGQWDTTVNLGGRAITKSVCISKDDADAINGDAKSIGAYVEKVSEPAGCKVTDVKVSGDQVNVTTVCAAGKENVGTTTYHGDSFETVNTNGAKSQSKWIGPCM